MSMARQSFAVAVPLLLLLLLLLLLRTANCCAARDFYVGGRDGWTDKPAEPFNRWAERNRFQVNDRLVFRYSKEQDSVLVVSQSHYDACNTAGPLLRLDGGDSVFVLGNSGPFFFISGDARRCQAGERLIVVVLAVRSRDNTPSPSLPPPPPPSPKSSSSSPPAPPTSPLVPAPAPRSLPPPPSPKSSSSPPAPPTSPPVPAPAPRSLPPPPPPPAAGNSSSPSPALAPTPGTNGTASPPSSASALRGGVLMSLVIGGAIILV